MKKITLLFTLLTLTLNTVKGQTIFNFDTNAVDFGNIIIETLDGVTVTFTGASDAKLLAGEGVGGSSGNLAASSESSTASSVTFTFNQPVVVNSIIAIEGSEANVNYTFTPTGGDNEIVVVSLVSGQAPTIALNWVHVTSFTVESSIPSQLAFDDLSVYPFNPSPIVFDFDTNAVVNGDTITETKDGITITFTGEPDTNLLFGNGFGGSSGDLATSSASNTATSVSFAFDQPVVVNSIIPVAGLSANVNYTFIPTGGSNSSVMVSLTSGQSPSVPIVLNWINVTAFTVTASAPSQMAFDDVSVYSFSSPTVFEWETAVDHGLSVTETVDGIMVTVTDTDEFNSPGVGTSTGNPGWGASGKVVKTASVNSVTFTFDTPVDVYSILVADLRNRDDRELTSTPIGGTGNLQVVVILVEGGVVPGGGTLGLNWTAVTGFTVQVTASPLTLTLDFIFDNLSVSLSEPLSVRDTYSPQKVKAYPNPVEDLLYIKNILGLKSIEVYNHLGQRVLESKKSPIDMSHLSKGLYVLQVHSSSGSETKKIIKK